MSLMKRKKMIIVTVILKNDETSAAARCRYNKVRYRTVPGTGVSKNTDRDSWLESSAECLLRPDGRIFDA